MGELFKIQDIKVFRENLVSFLENESIFCLLDSNDYYSEKDKTQHPYYHDYDMLCSFGARQMIKCSGDKAFEELEKFKAQNPNDWLFGYFSYDLKNEIEKLSSENADYLGFEDMFFFVPETVITLKGNIATVYGKTNAVKEVLSDIINFPSESHAVDSEASPLKSSMAEPQSPFQETLSARAISLKNRIEKEYYLETVEKLRQHIIEGDVYEVSFCQEFYGEEAEINPFQIYRNLCEISPQPFGAFIKIDNNFIMCASMERYLKKSGNKLISQPIKGTIRRGESENEDELLKTTLLNDEKERAENVMIVDLVRNDLSRVCAPGSVKVEELFGIYDFPGVFQMISTVTGELLLDKTGLDAIKASFPMGSMTGAPKIMAMSIIEQYEKTKRGVYSGAIGYFSPDGDFDFNVVIRTLLYNASKKYLSLHVGSAITYDSIPEREYEECFVKINTILKVLGNNH